jgi:hypothetical protein
MGKLTWDQARTLVDKGYRPDADLHPSMRVVKTSPILTPEDSAFADDFLRRLWKRVQARMAVSR